MKSFNQFVLGALALASCTVAVAQPYGTADQERRDRNRAEAIARHERMGESRSSVKEEVREGADTVRSKTRRAGNKAASFTNRQLDKVRNFGERQQAKFPPAPADRAARSAMPSGDKPVAAPPK